VSLLAERYRSKTPPGGTGAVPPGRPAPSGAPAGTRPEASALPLAVRLEQEIRAGRVDLPVLPQVAFEVQQLIDRDADLGALVKVIEREPTVAAALIKYANAAVYAGLRDVTQLDQALMRLGTDSVRQSVLSVTAKAAFAASDPQHQETYETIWLHSLTTAIAARRLAKFVSVAPETAFVAGLLHDIGRIVVLRGLGALQKRDPTGTAVPAHTIDEFTDALHCPLGDVLCQAWNIPAELRLAVARHHDVALTEPTDTLAALIQIADLMAAKVGASLHPDADIKLLDRPAFILLGLDDVKVAGLLVELEDERELLATII
jgi:HD-like signal output (HDOD) protein